MGRCLVSSLAVRAVLPYAAAIKTPALWRRLNRDRWTVPTDGQPGALVILYILS
jgi:hypothetical protein